METPLRTPSPTAPEGVRELILAKRPNLISRNPQGSGELIGGGKAAETPATSGTVEAPSGMPRRSGISPMWGNQLRPLVHVMVQKAKARPLVLSR